MTILINRFLLFLFLLPVNESFGVVLISDSESSAASSQTRSSARSTPLTDSDDSDSRDDDGTEDERFCEAEEWDGLKFPRTAACQEARLPCPRPEITVGFVVQRCGCGDTKWLPKPDTNNCVHKWVSELNEAIRNDDPAEEISRMFTNNLKETLRSGLYGGDITGSVDLSQELLPLARDQYSMLFDRDERSQKATAFTRDFGEAGDELLSEMAEQVWMGLGTEIRIAKASSLMSLLEQSAILMADFIYEKQKKMDFNNWALEVQIKKPPLPQSPVNDVPLGAIQPYSAIFPPGPRFSSPGPRTFSPQPFSDQPDLDQSYASEAQDQDEVQVRVLNPTVFAAPPPPPLSPVHPTQSAPQPNQPISFSGFSLSPSMSLPSISVLETSMEAASLDDQPVGVSGFGGYGAIPRSRFNSPNRNPMRLGYYVFKSVGPLLTPQGSKIINSMVIGASVNNPKQSLQLPKNNPVTFTFYHIHKAHVENPQCVFWDTMSRSWSTRGCTMLRTSNESTDCSCDHLTSFAILMDVTGKLDMVLSAESATALNVISIVGCVVSIVCLILCLIVFTCFRSLWNVRNTIHRNLCLCLLIAELVFVVGIDRTESKPLCCAIAVILHYFFLASFCWMLLEGYQLYLMLIQVFEPDNVKIIIYFLWAYGFPAVIVAVSAGVAWPSYGTPNYCWINVNSPTIWAFVGPITVVIVANIVFLAIALKVVMSVRTRDRSRTERLAGWLKGSATLLCLLGITWIFGYMMIVSQAEAVFAYIFTILNSIQGLFIFILHVLFNEKVRATLLRFFKTRLCVCCGLGVSEAGAAAYNSKSYLSSRQKILNMIRGSEATTGSNHNNSGLHHRSSDSSNATNGILNRSSKLSKNESFHDKEKCHSKKMNLPALSPVYLEFREKAHEDGAPNTAESTLQNDDSPKLNDAKCGGVDDEQPDSLSSAEYGGHFGADDGHFGADQGQFGADDDNDDHIEKFTNVTSRTESRKSATAAPVRRKKFPLGKTDSERNSQQQYSQKRNNVIVERF